MEPNLCFPHTRGYRTIHWSGQPNSDYTLNKNRFFFSKSCHLLMGLHLGEELLSAPLHSMLECQLDYCCLGPVQAVTAPRSPENSVFLLSSPTVDSYSLSTSSSTIVPKPWGGKGVIQCPICGWVLYRHSFFTLTSWEISSLTATHYTRAVFCEVWELH